MPSKDPNYHAAYREKNRERLRLNAAERRKTHKPPPRAASIWRAANPDKAENTRLKKLYGITLEQQKALFESQGSVCAVCGTDTPTGRGGWHVDHCHETKAVRGILCHHCNTGLGLFKDNPATLTAAINYLGK